MTALFGGETNYFGLDIGTTGIRLVQLKKSGGKPVLVTYGSIDVPAGIMMSDSMADHVKVANLVKQLVSDTKVGTKNVVAGLPADKVFASVITMPHLSDSELAKAIRYQADQYIPMALDQVKLDWSVIDHSPDGKHVEVLLVAAPYATTSKYLDILTKAGLQVLALETNATALARAFVPAASSLAVMVLDIASLSVDLTIMHNNVPKLMRSIPIGGNTFIKSVSQKLAIDEIQAQQFIYKFGLTNTKLDGQVLKSVTPALDSLVSEIQKSQKFFADRYPQAKLEKLVLSGGTAAMPELPTFMANSIGLPVEFGNAWVSISYPASLQDKLMASSNVFGVAAGLALRNL